VQKTIERFLALGMTGHPPTSEERLAELARELDAEIPAPVRALYEVHAGLEDGSRFPMRWLTPDEVAHDHRVLREQAEYLCPAADARYFWSDDNSNWAGAFVAGPLEGMVCILDHDEPSEVAQFRSVERFFDACVAAAEKDEDWYEMPTDFPVEGDLAPELAAADGSIVDQLRAQLAAAEGEEERERLALHILQLTPPARTAELMEFLDFESGRWWVQETAIRMLGKRDHAAAIDRIAEIVRRDESNNPVIAGIGALGMIRDPRAGEVLEALATDIDDGFDIYLDEARQMRKELDEAE
jgi:hypothetical protein